VRKGGCRNLSDGFGSHGASEGWTAQPTVASQPSHPLTRIIHGRGQEGVPERIKRYERQNFHPHLWSGGRMRLAPQQHPAVGARPAGTASASWRVAFRRRRPARWGRFGTYTPGRVFADRAIVSGTQTERWGDAGPVRSLLGGKPHRPLIEADRHRSKGLDQPRRPGKRGRRGWSLRNAERFRQSRCTTRGYSGRWWRPGSGGRSPP
jgi:hypothetical protein